MSACGHVGMWACGHAGMWACGQGLAGFWSQERVTVELHLPLFHSAHMVDVHSKAKCVFYVTWCTVPLGKSWMQIRNSWNLKISFHAQPPVTQSNRCPSDLSFSNNKHEGAEIQVVSSGLTELIAMIKLKSKVAATKPFKTQQRWTLKSSPTRKNLLQRRA